MGGKDYQQFFEKEKKMKKSIFLVILICYAGMAEGTVIFDDGWTHNITWLINDTVIVYDDDFFGQTTTVNVLDGGKIGSLMTYENSIATVSGGTTYGITAFDNSIVTVSAGQIGDSFQAIQNSTVTLSGGSISDDLSVGENSIAVVSGGSVGGELITYNNSIVTVSGGLIGGIIKAGLWPTICSTKITFKGTNFAINGHSVDYGTFDTGGQDSVHGTITGTLANGDPLNNEFYINGDSNIVLIPEPATLLLLGFGGLVLRKKRW